MQLRGKCGEKVKSETSQIFQVVHVSICFSKLYLYDSEDSTFVNGSLILALSAISQVFFSDINGRKVHH